MTESDDPRASATPRMRRLAASMARSGETLRTLPGRLSRSLAPSVRGKRRWLRDIGLLLVALLPFVIAVVVIGSRGGHGQWTVLQVQRPNWLAAESPIDSRLRTLIGEAVAFERARVRAPAPLTCTDARYQQLTVPAPGLFQGALDGRDDAQTQARALGLDPGGAPTLRVDCDNASFDYHRAGDHLLTLVDGSLVRLARR
jgi:hypothetical protein